MKPNLILTLGLLFLAAAGEGSAQPLPVDPQQAAFDISVSVHLVVLPVSVSNTNGRPVPELKEKNFEVYENGVRQTTRLFRHEDIPVTVGLVVDHSGSMAAKLTPVMIAARTFARSSNPNDEMFVVNFNEHVTFGLAPPAIFTNRAEELETAIMTAPTAGLTALYDAAFAGLTALQHGTREKKVLVVVSDGSDNASTHTLAEVLKLAEQINALVYAIGTFDGDDPDRNPAVLRRLARLNGGEAFFPGEISEVVAICRSIAEDIRTQYTLGYVSNSTAKPGSYRTIRVVAKAPDAGKLMVRTRTGYVVGDPANPQGAK